MSKDRLGRGSVRFVPLVSAGLACVVGHLASPCLADDFEWINGAGGAFRDPVNWQDPLGLGRIPGPADVAVFDLASTFTVTSNVGDPNTQVGGMRIRDGQVTFDLGAFVLTVGDSFGDGLIVGESTGQDGMLTMQSGLVNTRNTDLGVTAGSIGRIVCRGPGAEWRQDTIVGRLWTGVGGEGFVEIRDGAEVDREIVVLGVQSGSFGQLHVSDSTLNTAPHGTFFRSNMIVIGSAGAGDATIDAGSTIFGNLNLATLDGSSGSVSVVGPRTQLFGSISVGDLGDATFAALGGVFISGEYFEVSPTGNGSGQALLLGPGLGLAAERIEVISNRPASLRIGDAAAAQIVGHVRTAGQATFLQIHGPGTVVKSQSLEIGTFGTSNVCDISDGAIVSVRSNGISIGRGALVARDSGTTVESLGDTTLTSALEPSSLAIAGGAVVTTSADFIFLNGAGDAVVSDPGSMLGVGGIMELDGTLTVANGARAIVERVEIGDTGQAFGDIEVIDFDQLPSSPGTLATKALLVRGNGTIFDPEIEVLAGGTLEGRSTITASVLNHDGRVTPAVDVPGLHITGDFEQAPGGSLTMVFHSPIQGEYGRLDVDGAANLGGGELLYDVATTASIRPGIRFMVITSGVGLTGSFGQVRITRPNGVRPVAEYSATEMRVLWEEGMLLITPPLFKGQPAVFRVTNSAPNSATRLYASLVGEGLSYIAAQDVTLGIAEPMQVAGPVQTNAQGECQFTVVVPNVPGTPRVWLQAAQFRDASDIDVERIRDP